MTKTNQPTPKQIFVKFKFGQVYSWSNNITDPTSDCDYQAVITDKDLERMAVFLKN